jgi:hypothetical protein
MDNLSCGNLLPPPQVEAAVPRVCPARFAPIGPGDDGPILNNRRQLIPGSTRSPFRDRRKTDRHEPGIRDRHHPGIPIAINPES